MSWQKELDELSRRKALAALTEFAALAAPLRTPGPPSFGYRP